VSYGERDVSLYSRQPSIILGFHGCDRAVKEAVLRDGTEIVPSKNAWDWLGFGIYFWEGDRQRAFEWAEETQRRRHNTSRAIMEPSVIGAVIDLGNCLNLMDRTSIKQLDEGHKLLVDAFAEVNQPLPKNLPGRANLDCAVIQALHANIEGNHALAPYDTVRGLFVEGDSVYPDSFFHEKTHVQICVRNINCILGYFDPLDKRPMPFQHLQ